MNEHVSVAAAPPATGRQPLSRDLIVTRAIAYIDAYGLQHLTMRRLGQELGVEAMSLYRYVDGREDLLEGVVDRLVDGIPVVTGSSLPRDAGWQAFLQWPAASRTSISASSPESWRCGRCCRTTTRRRSSSRRWRRSSTTSTSS